MRILDLETNQPLNNICIYLTPAEAKDLQGSIKNLLEKKIDHHAHINDDTYQHEVTVTIYDAKNLTGYDERSKKLILDDQ